MSKANKPPRNISALDAITALQTAEAVQVGPMSIVPHQRNFLVSVTGGNGRVVLFAVPRSKALAAFKKLAGL